MKANFDFNRLSESRKQELVFILSQEEVHYVIHAISEKLDNIVCEGGTPFDEDANEDGII